MATPTTQPRNLASLYRLLLRTSQSTFEGDQRMITAWRSYVRQKLPQQAAEKSGGSVSGGTQQKLSDEFVNEWLDVVKMLKMNVVQGVREGPEESYRLRFTADTELGSNDSIKAGRDKQMADLRANKGSLGCGSGQRPNVGSSSGSSSSSSSPRAFSTSARLLDPREASKLQTARPRHLPHPPPHFPNTAILADGSTIQLTTTLPRSVTQLTRDPTNHPLWNPTADRRAGSGEDEAGRMNRFRKRFGGTDDDQASRLGKNAQILHKPQQQPQAGKQATAEASPKAAKTETAASKKAAGGGAAGGTSPQTPSAKKTPARSRAMFDLDDLDWMSGGRELADPKLPDWKIKEIRGGKRK